jgi:hypothetical protein
MSYYEPKTAFLTYSTTIKHVFKYSYHAYISAVKCSYNDLKANQLLSKICNDTKLNITFNRPSLYEPENQRLVRVYSESHQTEEIRLHIRKIIRTAGMSCLFIGNFVEECPYVKKVCGVDLLKASNDCLFVYHVKLIDKFNDERSFFILESIPNFHPISIRNDGVYTDYPGFIRDLSTKLKEFSEITFY